MDRGAWWATVHGVTESQIRLSDFIIISDPKASKDQKELFVGIPNILMDLYSR